MTIIESRQVLIDAITEITTNKILELYRDTSPAHLDEAKETDGHLVGLSDRIIKFISKLQCQPAGAVGPAIDAIDGGDMDTKESNESPTTDQSGDKGSEPATARVDGGSGSAGSGACPGLKQQIATDEALTTRLRTFKNDYRMSNMNIGKLSDVSDVTIAVIIKGDHVSDKTAAKVLAGIENYKPKGGQVKKPEQKKANGIGNRGAAEFIKVKLQSWLDGEDLDTTAAAGAMMIQDHALKSILAGHMPHSNIIWQLSKYIPEIKANESMLVAAAEQQEAA